MAIKWRVTAQKHIQYYKDVKSGTILEDTPSHRSHQGFHFQTGILVRVWIIFGSFHKMYLLTWKTFECGHPVLSSNTAKTGSFCLPHGPRWWGHIPQLLLKLICHVSQVSSQEEGIKAAGFAKIHLSNLGEENNRIFNLLCWCFKMRHRSASCSSNRQDSLRVF